MIKPLILTSLGYGLAFLSGMLGIILPFFVDAILGFAMLIGLIWMWVVFLKDRKEDSAQPETSTEPQAGD